MGFELLAWDSDSGWYEADGDDEGESERASVSKSHTTSISTFALLSGRASSPSSSRVSQSGGSEASMPSTTPSAGGRSKWPLLSGNSRPSTADTQWDDPIAEDSRQKGGRVTNAEGGQKVSKNARKRRNKARRAQAQAQAQEQAAQASLLEAALDVELPPSGPGSSWGDPDEVW